MTSSEYTSVPNRVRFHVAHCDTPSLHATSGRMIPSELERLIVERKSRGDIPFFVNCTAGTTVLGAFDPIEDIAAICQKYKCWMHVDVSSAVRHVPTALNT